MANDRPGKVLCLCSRCRVRNYLDDDGQQCPGKWVSPRTKSSHETSDQVKELKEAEEARERVENAILLSALSSGPASDPHSFAVRPRDLDTTTITDATVSISAQRAAKVMDGPTSIEIQEDTIDLSRPLGDRRRTPPIEVASRLDAALASLYRITPFTFIPWPITLFYPVPEPDRTHPDSAQLLKMEEALVKEQVPRPVGYPDAEDTFRRLGEDPPRVLSPDTSINRLRSFVLLALILVVLLHAHAAWTGFPLHVTLVATLAAIEVTIFAILATSSWSSTYGGSPGVHPRTAARDQLSVTGNISIPITYPMDGANLHDHHAHPATSQDKEAPGHGNDDSRRRSDPVQSLQHHTLSSWIIELIQSPGWEDTLGRATAIDTHRPTSLLWSNTWDAPFPPRLQAGYTADRGIYIACLNIPRSPKDPISSDSSITKGTKPSGLEREVKNLLIAWSRASYVIELSVARDYNEG
ncbi:hypothetical protein LXA43DRAFT_1099667 [Ganoderma leucocontextum]|nr:hypothetical protein LXA43DRAFT_1099667 [Ganoderma leucocontextum]